MPHFFSRRKTVERRLGMERLEDRALLAAILMTDFEQRMIEHLNRARANPSAEAAQFEIGLNDDLPPGTINTAAKQPLAPHPALIQAAVLHSQDMVDRNYFDHVNPDGKNPGQRMAEAGYSGARLWGENIAEYFTLDSMHRGLFESAGHRTNILNPDFKEVGVGIVGSSFGLMGTENFGMRNGDSFITGVAFSDQRENDSFFTEREGLNDVTITATRANSPTTFTTITGPTGGYALQVPAGTYTVKAEGGDLASPITKSNVVIGTANVKVDFIVPFVAPTADRFESNNTFDAATSLGGGDQQLLGLSIHDEDDLDFFRWTAPASGELQITLDLANDLGDVDLILYDDEQSFLDSSETVNQIESITRTVSAGSVYYIEVFGYLGDIHRDYDLLINGPGGTADGFEPNEARASAADAGSGDITIADLTIHTSSDEDHFRWWPATNGPFTVSATYAASGGAVDLQLLDSDGQVLDSSSDHDGQETVNGEGTPNEPIYVRVIGAGGATVAEYNLQFVGTPVPVARNDRSMTEKSQSVRVSILDNDSASGELDVSTIRIEVHPRFGTASIDTATGEILYEPPGEQRGSVRIQYSVADQYDNRTTIVAVDIAVLDLSNRPWTNPDDPLDIDANGSISPFDATLLLRDLRINGNRPLPVPSVANGFPTPYLDPSGDGRSSPQDALAIVSHLRRLSEGQGAEGELLAAIAMDHLARDVRSAASETPRQIPQRTTAPLNRPIILENRPSRPRDDAAQEYPTQFQFGSPNRLKDSGAFELPLARDLQPNDSAIRSELFPQW